MLGLGSCHLGEAWRMSVWQVWICGSGAMSGDRWKGVTGAFMTDCATTDHQAIYPSHSYRTQLSMTCLRIIQLFWTYRRGPVNF